MLNCGCLRTDQFFFAYSEILRKNFKRVFEGSEVLPKKGDSGKTASATWFSIFVELSNNDVLSLKNITNENLIVVLRTLEYNIEKNEIAYLDSLKNV